MDQKLLNILGCPKCKSKLKYEKNKLLCDFCNVDYSFEKNIPIFSSKGKLYDKQYYSDAGRGGQVSKFSKSANLVSFLRNTIKKITPSVRVWTKRAKEIVPAYLKDYSKTDSSKVVLNVGSGRSRHMRKLLQDYDNVLRLGISAEGNVDIVGDVRYLPFQDTKVDFISIVAVLEHVDDPARAVDQMHRALKVGGKIYAEIPFCRDYHEMPCDFYRFTISGIEKLFEKFKCLEKGIASGPGSAMSLAISSFCSILLSFNSIRLYNIWHRIFIMITKPIQYLDLLFQENKIAHRFSCTFYILCEKNK
jgi:SAM-dependent methyltransferase